MVFLRVDFKGRCSSGDVLFKIASDGNRAICFNALGLLLFLMKRVIRMGQALMAVSAGGFAAFCCSALPCELR